MGKLWRVAFVVGMGLVAWATVVSTMAVDLPEWRSAWLFLADPVLGVIAATLAIWRRRRPLLVALVVTVIGVVSTAAGGAVLLVLASVAARRRWRELAWLVPLNVFSGVASERLYPSDPANATPLVLMAIFVMLLVAVVVAVGYAVGGRRELHRERAEAAELDAQRRAAQAAAGERTRIAREMHDVLAHRISLVAMHAGALNYRTDLPPDQVRSALATIETNAHQALADLREVLGVLREPRADAGDTPEPPQPDITDLSALIAEASSLGGRVTFVDETEGTVPLGVGRTAYRVVQEALTNARKHAPGTVATVRLAGTPLAGLQVKVRNPRSVRPLTTALPASGLGLLGLTERVSLAGGHLRHGPDADGGYAVTAWLPWPAEATADFTPEVCADPLLKSTDERRLSASGEKWVNDRGEA
jgi:signal transduction histidine kinase